MEVPWVSSFGNDFNYDIPVSFSKEDIASGKAIYNRNPSFPSEEGPGASVFIARMARSSIPIRPNGRARHACERVQLYRSHAEGTGRDSCPIRWRGCGIMTIMGPKALIIMLLGQSQDGCCSEK